MSDAPRKPTRSSKRLGAPALPISAPHDGRRGPLERHPPPMPDFIPPALATLVSVPPRGEEWVHEIKLDGYRVQAHISRGQAILRTRGGLDWTARFGECIPNALARLGAERAIIDGEMVVENALGASDFAALQLALKQGQTERLLLYAFDLLFLNERDLRDLPFIRRRDLLSDLFAGAQDPLRFSEQFEVSGDVVKRHACQLRLEGIISKSLNDPYRGGRSGLWLKVKCSSRQEFVVAGFVPSSASADAVGSLVLGAYEAGGLRHVGRVGTGFGHAMARDLYCRLDAMPATQSPFARRLSAAARRGVRFTQPDLVAEIEFRGWSSDGLLRHATYCGLREDKSARDVSIERPKG